MVSIRRRLEDLNGWQRSWCVIALIWLLGCASVTVYNFPSFTEDEIRSRAISTALAAYSNDKDRIASDRAECNAKGASEGIGAQAECLRHLYPSERRYNDNIDWAIQKFDVTEHETLSFGQIYAAKIGTAIGILPCIGVYIFGISVAWINRGFKR